MDLSTSVNKLKTVGPKLENKLKKLKIFTVKDLLFHFPFRHEDWRSLVPIAHLKDGTQATVRGIIEMVSSRRIPRKRMSLTEALVRDESAALRVVWFNQPYLSQQLKQGQEISLSGKVVEGSFGLQMTSPTWERASRDAINTSRIIPIYPTTSNVTQKQLRFLVTQALVAINRITEWLSDELRDRADVCGLQEAIAQYHFPDNYGALQHAQSRLKFDELLLMQLLAQSNRAELKDAQSGPMAFNQELIKQYSESLPYTLTSDQKKAAWEILKDLEKSHPMNRMLEGDVGSGKTAVASIAALQAVSSGYQVAILAPTEVLAMQHYRSFKKLLDHTVKMGIWTRTSKEADFTKDEIIIGTHALLQESVSFENLGLIVVDEQHRFGVQQRKTLKQKSGATHLTPHFLSMTATPIPRSFALTVFGDLDISIIPTLPPGRVPIKTRIVQPHLRAKAYNFVRKQVQLGRQVFVIAPLIDGEGTSKKSVMSLYKKLSEEVFKDLRVGFLHGKLKAKEKQSVMDRFSEGHLDILVSTSVIEVGVDIPNASVMWIEGAEHFGLAQLHQFRGRAGRGAHQSYCLVFSDTDSEKSMKRLNYFEKVINGFALAEKDLEMRGPGEVFGKAQSGMMHLQLARLTDHVLIKKARELAQWVFENDQTLSKWPDLQKRFIEWRREVHLE